MAEAAEEEVEVGPEGRPEGMEEEVVVSPTTAAAVEEEERAPLLSPPSEEEVPPRATLDHASDHRRSTEAAAVAVAAGGGGAAAVAAAGRTQSTTKKEKAIRDLLQLCAEQNVSIPPDLRDALLGAEAASLAKDKSTSSNVSALSSALEQRSAMLSSLNEQELTKEVRELHMGLKREIPEFEVRVVDGSYRVTEKILDDDDDYENEGGGTSHSEEGVKKKKRRRKPRVDTVANTGLMGRTIAGMKRIWKTKKITWKTETETKTIMEGANLRLQSGKMYLVLGAPGCGKSTLLKMIAGRLPISKTQTFEGSVSVNGVDLNDSNYVWTNLVSYTDQIDRLHPYLTVKETMDFAWNCRFGGTHYRSFYPSDDPEVQAAIQKMDEEGWHVDAVLRGMGIKRVEDTFVGDDSNVRGVSGGERKRVTVSEMMCTGVPVHCSDEISTGLDAATTFDICRLMGEVGRMGRTIRVVSLLQPPPETVALFDEIILLARGRVIYAGPTDEVVEHFESLGYEIPERMDPADWLQSVSTSDGAQFLANPDDDEGDGDEERKTKRHLTTEEFVERFNSSPQGVELLESLEQPLGSEVSSLAQSESDAPEYTQRYHNTSWGSLKLLTSRETLLWWRDKYQRYARVVQDLVMGIIAGTVFWQQWENPQSVMGILFQSLFFVSLGAMVKIPQQIDVRGVFYKQQDANFFPTWSMVIGRSIAAVPTAVIDAVFYGTIIYWFVGLAHNDGASVGNYFVFMLLILISAYALGLMFGIFSATIKDRPKAMACMSLSIVVMVLFSGFTVQPDVIPNYWIWVYWINMYSWMLRALVLNEYQSGKYDEPQGDTGYTEGESILIRFGFTLDGEPFEYVWVWYGLLYAVGMCLISLVCTVFFLNKIRFETGKALASLDEDEDDEEEEIFESKMQVELPFQRVDLTFKDIRYTVTASTSKEKLELLKGIDGYIESGKMTALMGSSGAGKTTLMDVLSLRKSSGEIAGEVCLNGHPQESDSFRRCTGYVEQFDVQVPQLTIRETVEFSAKLRLDESDPSVTPETVSKFIDETLTMLELTPISDFLVGSDLTGGLSFEQRKRLSIAVELVSNPSILFLDEPTSGLDARAAAVVMRGLKRIATAGRAVCATIHQPSVAIFNSFDSLLLLKRGGETVYFGELGDESSNLIEYLERYESTPKIKPGENPATWMLTTIGAGSAGADGGSKPFDYASSYYSSKLREESLSRIEKFDDQATDENKIEFPTKYATSRNTQTKAVTRRMLKVYWRSPSYNVIRTFVSAIVALLFGSVFASQRTPETESDMNSRVTSIYITALFLGVNSFNTVLSIFEVERNMFYRHKAARMYNQSAITFAFTCAELPFILLSSMIFCVCFYFLVGFSTTAWKFFLYYLFFTLNMAMWTFLGQMMMSLFRDSATAQGFGAVLSGLSSIFTGVLIRPQNITGFWIFAYWLLPGHYVLEGLLVSQFHEDDTPITPSPGTAFADYVSQTSECQAILNAGGEITDCSGTAEQWIYVSFGEMFIWDHIGWNCFYLMGIILIAKLVTYIALTKLNYLAK